MATVVSRSPKIYSYRADGLHVLTPRRLGETRYHEEVTPYKTLSEKEKKRQKQIDAVKRKNNSKALRKIVR